MPWPLVGCHPFLFTSISVPDLQKLMTISFRWDFSGSFLRTRPWHHQKNEHKKTASQNKMLIHFYILQWLVDIVITNNMMKPGDKPARHVFMYYSDQYKKSAPDAVQYCGICVEYLSNTKLPPRCIIFQPIWCWANCKVFHHKYYQSYVIFVNIGFVNIISLHYVS